MSEPYPYRGIRLPDDEDENGIIFKGDGNWEGGDDSSEGFYLLITGAQPNSVIG
jgi:hypothetical protein